MTDKELLELAAKAAGYTWKWNADSLVIEDEAWHEWNPLTDDGDALRLSVKLKIAVTYPEDDFYVRVWYGGMETGPIFEAFGGDRNAATRRAITRAAAEIGKTMKS